MVNAIIFDCFGVLTTDYWKEFVATLPTKQVGPARALNYQYDAGSLREADFVRQVKDLTGHEPPDIVKLNSGEMVKNETLFNYIGELKKAYKISLLSNIGSNWIRGSFLTDREQALFDDMVFSYEVHLAKPDAEIFELAAARLDEKAQDCVFIDDSQGHCAAASQLGMRTIIYSNFEQMKSALEPLLSRS